MTRHGISMYPDEKWRQQLAATGWALLHGIRAPRDLIAIAESLGRPKASPSGELVRTLVTRDRAVGRRRTFTAECGRGAIPFHTDTAFWPVPARYVVMQVDGDLRRSSRVLSFDALFRALPATARPDIGASVWLCKHPVPSAYRKMTLPIKGWRYDPLTMVPANASAKTSERGDG